MTAELAIQIITGVAVAANIFLTMRLANVELRVKLWGRETFVTKNEYDKDEKILGVLREREQLNRSRHSVNE